jgi:hypothetical protein
MPKSKDGRSLYLPIGILSLLFGPVILFLCVHSSPLLRQTHCIEMAILNGSLDIWGGEKTYEIGEDEVRLNKLLVYLDSVCSSVDTIKQRHYYGMFLNISRKCSYGQFVHVLDVLSIHNFHAALLPYGTTMIATHKGYWGESDLPGIEPLGYNVKPDSHLSTLTRHWKYRYLYIIGAIGENGLLLLPLLIWAFAFILNIHRSLHHYQRRELRITT